MNILIVSKELNYQGEGMMDLHRFTRMVTALQHAGFQAQHSWAGTLEDLTILLDQARPDLVFSAAYSVFDKRGIEHSIHTLLEQRGIPYVGSNAEGLELALSKPAMKAAWGAAGILTPDYFLIRKNTDGDMSGMENAPHTMDFPYILKPAKEGNSRGLSQKSIVWNQKALIELAQELLSNYDEILVEKYLGEDEQIREFTIAMIGNNRQKLILPCEIVLNYKEGSRVITTADKYGHGTQAYAVDDQDLRENLIRLAKKAFKVAGVRDYARFDVLYSHGKFYAIEINGQPMVPDLWFEACARGEGLDTDQYLNAIFLASILRNIKTGHLDLQIPGKIAEILPGDVIRRIILEEKEKAHALTV